MKLFLSKLLPLFTAGVILLCSVFALVPIESFAESYYFSGGTFPGQSYTFPSTSFVDDVVSATLVHNVWGTRSFSIFSSSSIVYYVGVINDNTAGYSGPLFFSSSNFSVNNSSTYANRFSYNGLDVYYYASNWVASSSSFSPSPFVHINITASDHNVYIPRFAWLLLDSVVNSTPSPEPTVTPAPTPSGPTALPFDQYFRPFRSFTGLYYDSQQISFPESLTRANYQQYSGIVSNHDLVVTDCRSNLDFYDDKVVYKFEYDIWPKETDSYSLNFCYDADNEFGYAYVYYTVSGVDYDGLSISQQSITGTYTVYGAYDIDPTTIAGPPYYHWDVALDSQRNVSLNGVNFNANTPVTVSVIVASSTLPHIPSTFDWSQFFQDTRPDNVFLATSGGLAALPFFVSGLSFLALGALIGIVLKFMR